MNIHSEQDSEQNVNALRSVIKAKREALSKDMQQLAAQAFCNYVLNWDVFQQSRHIGLYFPYRGELDVFSIFEQNLATDKVFYLPLIQEDHTLLFTGVNQHTQWETNKYGIKEPIPSKLVNADTLDLVFCPLVAFDKNNHRIGQGGGYYDRTFAFKLHNESSRPLLAGVGYDFQEVSDIEQQPWDVSMDCCISI